VDMYEAFVSELEKLAEEQAVRLRRQGPLQGPKLEISRPTKVGFPKLGVDYSKLQPGVMRPNPLPAGAKYTNPINPQPAAAAPTRVKSEPGHWPTKAPAPVTSYSLPKTERPAAPAAPAKFKPMLKVKGASLEDLQLMFNAFMDEIEKTAV